ncbi:unnamed protein product [Arabis nemorensis]|uniref:Uncharacterized protein n=1 Tax=Arabis nemorensis TaxID=586526 RepID=A0A565B8U3_9BRAS|nr:unnamed protein product [Arabis nemorensis]
MGWTELLPWLLSHRLHMNMKRRCDKNRSFAVKSMDAMCWHNQMKLKVVYAATEEKAKPNEYNSDTASRGLGRFFGALFGAAIVFSFKMIFEKLWDDYKNTLASQRLDDKLKIFEKGIIKDVNGKFRVLTKESRVEMEKIFVERMKDMEKRERKKTREELEEMERKLKKSLRKRW